MNIKALSDSIEKYSVSQPDKAIHWVNAKREQSQKIKWYFMVVKSELNRTSVYIYNNDLINIDISIKKVDEYLKFYTDKLKDKERRELTTSLEYKRIYYYLVSKKIEKAKSLLNNMLVNTRKNKNLTKEDSAKLFYANYELGNLFLNTENFEKAGSHLNEALEITLSEKGQEITLIFLYNAIGLVNAKLKQDKKIEYYFDKAVRIINTKIAEKKITTEFSLNASNFFLSSSNILIELGQYEKALNYLKNIDRFKTNEQIKASYHHRMGSIYFKKGDFDKAFDLFNKALLFSTKYDLNIKKQILIDIARFHLAKKNKIKALQSTQSALITLSQTFDSKNYQRNPSVSEVFSKKDLLETLDFKAGVLLDLAQKQPEYVNAAYNTAQLAASLIDTIRADYTSDFDKQYLAEWSYGVYEKAINSALLMYQKTGDTRFVTQAFNALERSKAIVLLEALKTGQAESALNDDDRNRLYQYKAELQKLETQIYDETTKNKKAPDDPSVRALQNRLFDVRRQYDALVKSFETLYPEYYKVKFNQKFVQLKEVQNLLPSDGSSSILEYFVGEKFVFTFLITKNSRQIFKKEKPIDFEPRTTALRQVLMLDGVESRNQFINHAAWLYDLILKDPLSICGSKTKKLILIPDDILSYIPFEMLFNPQDLKGNSWSDIPYLLQKYTISYANSGNLLSQQMKPKDHQARQVFAGFAAQYKPNDAPMIAMRAALTRDNAYNLPYAQKEVATIQSIIGGDLFTQNASGEGVFKAKANQFRILHFAMHAVPDSLNPTLSKLLFTFNPQDSLEDNDLTAAEIYAMCLNADLATLSACQTGFGKINRGEGVMSLSRAFAYAGVPATIMSLWKVPDNTTNEIMVAFYQNLKAGQNKDDALRNAKQTFLSNHAESTELQNPFYWAGFVAVGNMNPIDTSSPNQRVLFVGLILGIFVVSILLMRSKVHKLKAYDKKTN